MQKYNLLCQNFLSAAEPRVSRSVLDNLKKYYERDVKSIRKLSEVKNFEALIRLLEKREIISYDNIEELLHISKMYINNPDLESKLQEYEKWLQTAPQFCNKYQTSIKQSDQTSIPLQRQENIVEDISESYNACSSTHNFSQVRTTQNLISSANHATHSCEIKGQDDERTLLQQKVLLQLSERLGRSWRDVARHLEIRECEIDAVQNKYPHDLKEQSYEILKVYISQSDKKRWAIDIIRALEKGRRKDLKEFVEELLLKDKDK